MSGIESTCLFELCLFWLLSRLPKPVGLDSPFPNYLNLKASIGAHHFKWKRPFPSSLVALFQNESKCETIHIKMSSACSFIQFMQIKVIFIRMVSHLDSL